MHTKHIKLEDITVEDVFASSGVYVVDGSGESVQIRENLRMPPFVSRDSEGTISPPQLHINLASLSFEDVQKAYARLKEIGVTTGLIEPTQ